MLRLFAVLSGVASAGLALLPLPVVAQSPDLPSRAEAEAVCRFAADDPSFLRGAVLTRGLFDANNDGVVEDVGFQPFLGTAGGGDYRIKTREGTDILIQRVGFEWKDFMGDGGGWLPYDGRIYYLPFRDGNLSHLSYITPANEEYILCEFDPRFEEHVFALSAADEALCAQLAESKVSFVPVEPIALEAPRDGRRWLSIHGGYAIAFNDRRWTFLQGRAQADFDNDGDMDEMQRLLYASGAGRGCDYEYYDMLSGSAAAASEPSKRGLLLKVQKVDPGAMYPGPHCYGNLARWFTFEERTYFETRYRGERPSRPQEEFHEAWVVEGVGVRQVCGARFALRYEAARYNPLLKSGQ